MTHQIVLDSNSRRYVIPSDNQEAWEEFSKIPDDDPRSWKVPEWAERIGGEKLDIW